MWRKSVGHLAIEPARSQDRGPLATTTLTDVGIDRRGLLTPHRLRRNRLEVVGLWWRVDAGLNPAKECMVNASRSHKLGLFLGHQST